MVPLVFCRKEAHQMVKSVSTYLKSTVDAVKIAGRMERGR